MSRFSFRVAKKIPGVQKAITSFSTKRPKLYNAGKKLVGSGIDIGKGMVTGGALGGAVSSEVGASWRGTGVFQDGTPGFLDAIMGDKDAQNDLYIGATTGAIAGLIGTPLVVAGKMPGYALRAAEMGLGYLDPYIQHNVSNDKATIDNANEANAIALLDAKAKNDQNTIKAVGLTLGAGGLGLAGYALYDYIKDKQQRQSAPPKVKVRLKGKDSDVYDDATVEVPLQSLRVSKSLSDGVNRSVRRVLRENNRFGGRKKDPITGELISYQEFIDKYGDPEQQNKKPAVINQNYES